MISRHQERRTRPRWRFVAFAAILASTVFARALAGARQDQPKTSKEDEATQIGEDLTVKVCSECHEFDQVVALRRTPREWKDMMTTMANKGANASPDEFATIRQYLVRNYGVVAVNAAPAADLSAVLGLSAKDAEAVVAYRTDHGKFGNLEALLKVPGLEKSKLGEEADALRFD